MSSKDNSGALFKNDKKREGKQDADYTGNITIEGREYWINAWLNKTQGGMTYMGLKVSQKKTTETKPKSEVPF